MITRSFPPQSNHATFSDQIKLYADDGSLIDNSLVSEISVHVRNPRDHCIVLTATLTGGEITGSNPYTYAFTATQMGPLCALTYELGVIATVNGVTDQTHLCRLPIIDGL